MYHRISYPSPVGDLTLASDGNSLVGLWMAGQKYFGGTLLQTARETPDLLLWEQTHRWLDRYFAGERPAIAELPLNPLGGDFRRAVWRILCDIPYGEVTTYGEIAKQMAATLGKPSMSSQAVGGAVGHNPISIIIPCHRVVGTSGSLTGYAGGIDVKVALLKHEGADLSGLFVPKRGTAL